jgi:hypothetical protein
MTRLETYIARWIIQRIMSNDYAFKRLVVFFKLMRSEADRSFTEDNEPTVNAFLRDAMDQAIVESNKY